MREPISDEGFRADSDIWLRSLSSGAQLNLLVEQLDDSCRSAINACLASPAAMALWLGDEKIQYHNEAFDLTLGKDPGQAVLGRPARESWPTDWSSLNASVQAVIQHGRATAIERPHVRIGTDGSIDERHVSLALSPVSDTTGKRVGALAVVTDITVRCVAQRRMRMLHALSLLSRTGDSAEAKWPDIADCLSENAADIPYAAIYYSSPERRELVDSTTHHASGMNPQNAIARALRRAENGESLLTKVIRTGQSELIALDGESSIRHAMAMPLRDARTRAVYAIMIVAVNPLRCWDSDYRGFIDLLGDQVAQILASEPAGLVAVAPGERTSVISNISRELCDTLTLMLGPVENVLRKSSSLSAEDRRWLSAIKRHSHHLVKVVSSLHELTDLDSCRKQARYEATDLAALTSEIAHLFRPLMERAGLKMVISCLPIAEPVYVDRGMWERIVANLLSNALKFTMNGFVSLTLGQAQAAAELCVSDTGIGFPDEEIARAFDWFHRISGNRGRSPAGAGVGLALVKSFARIHGGTVALSSSQGKGSVFTIRIPLGKDHLPAEQVSAAENFLSEHLSAYRSLDEAEQWIGGDETDGIGMTPPYGFPVLFRPNRAVQGRVLVADPNPEMRHYLNRMLSHRYQVEVVADGANALTSAQASPPDLVLADTNLPVLDGFALLRHLRADLRTGTIPVVLTSSTSDNDARLSALEAGADDFLLKPFGGRELMARIAARLDIAQIGDRAREREHALLVQAEEAHQTLDSFLSSAPVGYWMLDKDLRVLRVNQAMADYNGLAIDSMIGKHLREVLPLMADTLEPLYRQVLETGKALLNIEVSGKRGGPASENKHWLANKFPVRTRDGRIIGIGVSILDVTDRKRSQEALRQSEQSYRFLADGIPQFVWTVPNGEIADYCNRWWYEYTGTEPGTRPENWVETVHPDDLAAGAERWMKAQIDCQPYENEARFRRADGVYRWHLVRMQPILDSSGHIFKWVGTGIDIDDRVELQRTVVETRDQLLAVLNAVPAGISWISADLTYLGVNPFLASLFRLSAEEFIGRPVGSLGADEAFVGFVRAFFASADDSESTELSVTLPGEEKTFLIVAKKYHQGQAAVFVATDITERNQSQALLRESRELFVRFMNNSPSVAFMKDGDGHYVYVNALFEKLFSGLGEVLGKTDYLLFPAEYADRFRAIDQEVLRSGNQVEIIERVPQADGDHHWLSNKFTFRDEKGRNLLGCVSTDITGRMQIEAALAQKVGELAMHDNKLARLGLLVSGVAHEINNPANFISLSTPLLRDAWDSIVPILDEYCRANGEFTLLNMDYSQAQPYIRDLFQSIDSGVQRIKRIVQELTAFSRKDVPEQADDLDIRLVVKAAVGLLKHQIRKSTDHFSETYDAGMPTVIGNFQRLEQVFVNLIQNACQALPSRERKIAVHVGHDESAQNVVIQVSDEGVGIPSDALPRITEPFYTTKHDHGGTGLGLSIAAKIIEEHCGAISFVSDVGRGTTVTIILPCVQKAAAPEGSTDSALFAVRQQ